MSENIFEQYKQELEKELTINEFSLKEVQLNLPANRHKWVARLMVQKRELNKLKKLKDEAITKLIDKLNNQSPVTVSAIGLKKQAESHEVVLKINEEIDNCELLIEYLEKVETVYRNTTYDIKNLIHIITLETT